MDRAIYNDDEDMGMNGSRGDALERDCLGKRELDSRKKEAGPP